MTLKKLTIKNTYKVTVNKQQNLYFLYIDKKTDHGWTNQVVNIYDKSDVNQHNKIINSIVSGEYQINEMIGTLKEVLG